ncbi:MAG: recombinase RecA [Planctomycetes bacterium]|nr:recombinase RecA [Planctomycetota bacterium]
MAETRYSTGVPGLDDMLGGGLLPGTLTVVLGATGIGKTQLGVHFAAASGPNERRRGIFFDMGCRGDAQNHQQYARRMYDWPLVPVDPSKAPVVADFFAPGRAHGDYLHVFDYHGRRVTRSDLGFEAWQDWQAEIARKLGVTIAFCYGNFVQGARRVVIDGIEPVDKPSESIQFELFEYLYHQLFRKDAEWVARDLFREHYREFATAAAEHTYPAGEVASLLLVTTAETMLEQLISRPLDEGDTLANANTLIYLGKLREGNSLKRAVYVAKHRGSACSDEIVPFTIGDRGWQME